MHSEGIKEEEDVVCLVCADDSPPLYRACECRSSAIHAECLRNIVTRVPSHADARCAVCLARYEGVRFETPRVSFCSPMIVGLYFHLSLAWVLLCAIVPSQGEVRSPFRSFHSLVLVAAAFTTLVTCAIHLLHVLATSHELRREEACVHVDAGSLVQV